MTELRQKASELQRYAGLEENELSDLCAALISAAFRAEFASDEFSIALDKEISEQLKNFQENATIVECEETFTRKVAVLEWTT